MLFFLGLLVGGTSGFLIATLMVAASRDAAQRDGQDVLQAPELPEYLRQAPVNSGRYEVINEAAVSRHRMRTGTED